MTKKINTPNIVTKKKKRTHLLDKAINVSDQEKKKKTFLREYFFLNEHGNFQSLLPFTTIKKINQTNFFKDLSELAL